jgi:predicted metal-dependent peptidase
MIKRHPFFGYLALSTEIEMVDNESGILTAGVDGRRMYINTDFFYSLSKEKRESLITHEVMHLALRHVPRRKWRMSRRWNVAADFMVNETMLEQGVPLAAQDEGDLVTAQSIMRIHGISMPDVNTTTAEYVYNILPDTPTLSCPDDLMPSKGMGDMDDSEEGRSAGGEHNTIPDEEYWRNALSAAATYVKKNNYGRLPGWLERVIGFSTPRLDWRSLLTYFIGTLLSDRRTYRALSRRHIWRGAILPRDEESKLYLVVAVDASGSITPKQLSEFMGEVGNILEGGRTLIKLYVHDVKVTERIIVRNQNDLPERVRGGGGTSFIPTTDEIEELFPRPDGIIWLTDGWGSFPEKEPSIPVLWVLTKNADEPPYGWTTFIERD